MKKYFKITAVSHGFNTLDEVVFACDIDDPLYYKYVLQYFNDLWTAINWAYKYYEVKEVAEYDFNRYILKRMDTKDHDIRCVL